MVLVDSSVWIALLRSQKIHAVDALRALLDAHRAALTPVVFQEILQGASSPENFAQLRDYFGSLPFLVGRHIVTTHADAGELYAQCRWRGITPRSPIDCVVAQVAIDNQVPLLAHDRDFDAIARVEPRLRLYKKSEQP